jgi:hypothetical protein
MSGANNQGPPDRLTPIAGDQPIGNVDENGVVRPTQYFFQMMQRILSYLGQPGQGTATGAPNTNLTVSEQLTYLMNAVDQAQFGPGAAAIGLDGRVSTIERLLRRLPWYTPKHPRSPAPDFVIPGAPAKPAAIFRIPNGPLQRVPYQWFPAAPTPPTIGGSGTVTDIATGTGLTGGPITNSGTVSFASIGASEILGNPSATSAPPIPLAIGSGLSLSAGGTLSASGSGGTVTDVATSGAGISGGPITTTGTLTVEWNAGTVSALDANSLAINSGTLQATGVKGSTSGSAIAAGYIGELLTAKATEASSTVTLTLASPGVVNWPAHGLSPLSVVQFATNGSLPTGLTAGTNYYVTAGASLLTNSFQVSTTIANAVAGTSVNFTGSQSGTQTAVNSAAVPTATGVDIVALQVTAGIWDIWGQLHIGNGGAATINEFAAFIATISHTPPAITQGGYNKLNGVTTGGELTLPTGSAPMVFSSLTTIYLSTNLISNATVGVGGVLFARRVG